GNRDQLHTAGPVDRDHGTRSGLPSSQDRFIRRPQQPVVLTKFFTRARTLTAPFHFHRLPLPPSCVSMNSLRCRRSPPSCTPITMSSAWGEPCRLSCPATKS